QAGDWTSEPKIRKQAFLGVQVFVNRAHVRELQAPAKLNAKEPETHVPDLPEAQSWFLHKGYLLVKIAAERFGKLTRMLPSCTVTALLAPRRSIKDVPLRSAIRDTLNSISAGWLSLLSTTITTPLCATRAYAYCCSET